MVNSGRGTKVSGATTIQMPLSRYTEMKNKMPQKVEVTKPSFAQKQMYV